MSTILIAGGGTGGHVFPGLAVAEALALLADVEVVFVGTPRGLEKTAVPARGLRLELLDVEPMKGGGLARMVRGGVIAAAATAKGIALVRRLRPSVVLSVGGYAAGPVSLAASLLRVPLAVLEPNGVLGFANRLLAPFAQRVYVAWDGVAAKLPASRVRRVGVPLRPGFVPRPYAPRGSARVLVMGGSQGAAALNERLPQALAIMQAKVPALDIVHQAGRDRDAAVRDAYAREKVTSARVVPFLEDVAAEIAAADVVVARAGAVTVAEIAAIGRASILIPFPHAADDHQAKNAAALASAGGAVAIRQEAADATRIAGELTRLLEDDAARSAMADAAATVGKPDAASDVAKDLLELAHIARRTARGTNGARHTNGGARATEAR